MRDNFFHGPLRKNAMVYYLFDPRDGRIRYVGKTAGTGRARLRSHFRTAWASYSHPVERWIVELLNEEVVPLMTILEEVPRGYVLQAEKEWITYFLSLGFDLLNIHHGDPEFRKRYRHQNPKTDADAARLLQEFIEELAQTENN